ncbi:hypothetical protein Tco_1367315 [Tanacetum coccineum]
MSTKVSFRVLFNNETVEDTDFVLPVENVMAARNKFANSLVGFFVGKSKVIRDDDGVFYFKFTSITGMEQVMEKCPWMIRNQPLILTKWEPNLTLSKDAVKNVPIWVKIHKIPVVAYYEDGLSLIASQIGKPIMLDAFTSAMCADPWGRMGFARALIEVSAEKALKQEVVMAVPNVDGEGHTKEQMPLEFEWKPSQCTECCVFGHTNGTCPKRVVISNTESAVEKADGFTLVTKKKKKAKTTDNNVKQFEGVKFNKPKTVLMWSKKTKQDSNVQSDQGNGRKDKGQASTVVGAKANGSKGVISTNQFEALENMDDPFDFNDVGQSSKWNISVENFVTNEVESDSEVDEVLIMEKQRNGTKKGTITPSDAGLNVYVCGILESHVDISSLSRVCSKVFRSWDWISNVNHCDKGCRIIVGWNKDVVDVMVVAQTSQVVHVKIKHKTDKKILFFSFVYASNSAIERRRLWNDLGIHKLVTRDIPWILMGDFNVALNLEDVHSGVSSISTPMYEFKDCVANIKVMDINRSDLQFTWNQKPKGGSGVLKKLDRVMGNIEFINAFLGAYAVFQPYRNSDHSPSVLKFPSIVQSKPKPFKFFNFLTHKSNFMVELKNVWSTNVEGHNMFKVVSKLKALKTPMRKLMHANGNLHDRVQNLRVKLDAVQTALDRNPNDTSLQEEEAVYLSAFNEAKIDEERYLKQKAKIEWLDVGDSNSAYFHKTIKSKNSRSQIDVLLDSSNNEVTGTGVSEAFVNHYKTFLGIAATCDLLDTEGLFVKTIPNTISNDMIRPITNDEIRRAMFNIEDDRAPGLDGFTLALFKKGWSIVGDDVCNAVRDFFH